MYDISLNSIGNATYKYNIKYTSSYKPMMMPMNIARGGIEFMDSAAHLFKFKPIMSISQIKLMTDGNEPKADHARKMLDWNPLTLDEGIHQYLKTRIVENSQEPQMV